MFCMLDVVLHWCLSHLCGWYRTQNFSMAMQRRCDMWFLCHIDHVVRNLRPSSWVFAYGKQSKTEGGEMRLGLETITGYVLSYLEKVCSKHILRLALAFQNSNSSSLQLGSKPGCLWQAIILTHSAIWFMLLDLSDHGPCYKKCSSEHQTLNKVWA